MVVLPFLPCGDCLNCLAGKHALCLDPDRFFESDFYGGFGEFVCVPEGAAIPAPKGVPLDEAAALPDVFCTSFNAMRLAQVEAGKTVAVFGSGNLGCAGIQFAKLAGARVIAIDIKESRLHAAEDLGADVLIDATKCDPVKRIYEITGVGADASCEFAGAKESTFQAIDCVHRGGRIVLIGATEAPLTGFTTRPFNNKSFSISRGLTLLGCRAFGSMGMIRTVFELASQKAISIGKSTVRVSLGEVDKGFELKRGEFNNILVKPS